MAVPPRIFFHPQYQLYHVKMQNTIIHPKRQSKSFILLLTFCVSCEIICDALYAHCNTDRYRSGHNGADSKNFFVYPSRISKTLDFIEVWGLSDALSQNLISQFSRKIANTKISYGEISKWS